MYTEIIQLELVQGKNIYEIKQNEKYFDINIDPIQIQKTIIGSIIFIRDVTEKVAEEEKKKLMDELIVQIETKK